MKITFSLLSNGLIMRTVKRINKPPRDILLNYLQSFEQLLFQKMSSHLQEFKLSIPLNPIQVKWLTTICEEYHLSPFEVFEFFFDLEPKN